MVRGRTVIDLAVALVATFGYMRHEDNKEPDMTDKKLPELLPCPFCGETPKGPMQLTDTVWLVKCARYLRHDAYVTSWKSAEDAVSTWNTRAQQAMAAVPEDRLGKSASMKQILPARKRYPKPDENGNDTGPCCAHAYADGWNECLDAIKAGPQPSAQPKDKGGEDGRRP